MCMKSRFTFLTLLLLFSAGVASAQIFNPVSWTTSYEHVEGNEYLLIFEAEIESGWAVYSQFLESDEGPVATTLNYESTDHFKLLGKAEESGHKKEGFDAIFEMNVTKFNDEFRIVQRVEVTEDMPIKGYLNYMTCDDERCLPPTDVEFDFDLKNDGTGAVDPESEGEAEDAYGTIDFSAVGSDEAADVDIPNNNILQPVKWSGGLTEKGGTLTIVFEATIDEGWHIYGQDIEDGGPVATAIMIDGEAVHFDESSPMLVNEMDNVFEMEITKLKKSAKYTYVVENKHSGSIEGEIIYMACDVEKCIFPSPEPFVVDLDAKTLQIGDGEALILGSANLDYPVPPVNLEQPVVECGAEELAQVNKKGLGSIFFLGFFGGLLALLTPCVFPMIPLTVSFFTKGSDKNGVQKAVLYGFFILLTYVLLSIPFHLLDSVNPGILNDISTNVYLNLAFFAIFIFFAFSFFGYYEITIPARWTNKVSNAESVGGIVGIFFMALTLALVSFSCTGPILGTLLAGALTSEGGAMQLTAGMSGFGLALALPFALFAAFPSMLSGLPKSGGWLNTVKVVLGFIELALAFKFLSNADLVKRWGLLKIEPFLAIWVIVALGLAAYLFGKIKFPHDSPIKKLSPLRVTLGAVSLAFAIYLMTGFVVDKDKGTFKSLTLLSGLAPPAGYSWVYPKKCPNNLDCFKDLSEGVAYAKKVNKPIMIDFTGHACVNCRKMEEQVWPKGTVNERLQNDYVLISLYVDEKIELPEEQKTDRIRNYGQKWATFQAEYFNNNSQPYYVLLSPDGKLLNNPVGYTPDVEEYAAFLDCGLQAFETINGQMLGAK